MAKYALGFVSGFDGITLPFFNSVFKAAQRDGCHILSILSGPVLHRARNELVAMYLRDCPEDSLLMVDSDIEFSTEDIDAIYAHDYPVVSGVYPRADGEPITDGCGFLRIDRSVLEVLGPHPFNPIKTQDDVITGEDVGFRSHVGKAGWKVLVDTRISVGHVKPRVLRIREPDRQLALAQ